MYKYRTIPERRRMKQEEAMVKPDRLVCGGGKRGDSVPREDYLRVTSQATPPMLQFFRQLQ